MSATAIAPGAGADSRVRQRLYLVEQSVPPANPGDVTLVRLSCVDDDAQGQPLEALWERELDGRILTAEDWDSISKRGFDPPERFAAYLNAYGGTASRPPIPTSCSRPFARATASSNSSFLRVC